MLNFSERVDAILEQGHWDKYDPNKRTTIFSDPRSTPGYKEMDPASGKAKKTVRKDKKAKGFQKSYALKGF
jgi:hypothetical protein